ncbi:MAG: ferritin-like domain-containing protein [Hyphomicrobiaceae bacterium]
MRTCIRELRPHKSAIPILNGNLANVIDLKARANQAHWNGKEPKFCDLEPMFDEFCAELELTASELGKRIMALGGVGVRTAAGVATMTRLQADPVTAKAGEHLNNLIDRYRLAVLSAYKAVVLVAEADDRTSAELLTRLVDLLEKQLAVIEVQTRRRDLMDHDGLLGAESRVSTCSHAALS